VRQSRTGSAIEAVVNLAVGYAIAVALTYWMLGVTPQRAAGVSAVFTVASLARSYGLRRLFARWGGG
jgi:hypothetical protein